MKRAIPLLLLAFAMVPANAQTTEWIFNPERTGELTDAFAVYAQNGARGVTGPWDLDQDGRVEMLVSQHSSVGGMIHVIENVGPNTWEHVYSTALLDSSATSFNARYAVGADMDQDGNWEIIYVAGSSYTTSDATLVQGVYVWEHDGVQGSDNYGTRPASIAALYEIDALGQSNWYADNIDVGDVDGDGTPELLIPANGPSAKDFFYVISVAGTYETDGLGTGFETWVIESKENPRLRDLGGGSPYAVYWGDFNGDSFGDISYHAWNSYNFFTSTTNGADTYLPAHDGQYQKLSGSDDDVAIFGGTVVDIDKDGNDEVFYSALIHAGLTVIDYDDFEDTRSLGPDNIGYNLFSLNGIGGVDSADLDGDGALEIIAGGAGYGVGSRRDNAPSYFITVAEYNGGPVTESSSYSVLQLDTSSPVDTLGFHRVIRDSLGTVTTRFELAVSKQGSTGIGSDPVFPSRIANLGDPDGDGDTDIAISFQGVDDSLYVYREVWNADSLRYDPLEVIERIENPVRAFVRVISVGPDLSVSTEGNRIVLPSDYRLSANYPNPFNPSTSFSITLPVDKSVSVRVYDVSGRLVRTLVGDQFFSAGTYEFTWDGTNEAGAQVASGTYLYALEYGNFRQSKTMVLLK